MHTLIQSRWELRTLTLKGQLVSLEGKIKYRTVEEDVEGKPFKHTIAEIHASSMRRLSKVEAADDPTDGADEE